MTQKYDIYLDFCHKKKSKSLRPPNASTFPLKRQRVYRQTPKRFRQNVKEFPSKRKDVSPPVTSPHSCFPKAHIKIPLNRFQNLLNTPNLCVNNPIQKTSEKGLPCILPSERINPSRQKDRNPARILHKRHHSIPEKEKNSRRKRMPAISRHTPFICFCFIVISQSLSELCCKNRRFSYL